MASLRVPALRHVVSNAEPYLRVSQRRWAQVHDVRFVATQHSDRILERYREKLNRKAREEGLRDLNELKEVYQDNIKKEKKKAVVPIPKPPPPSAPLSSAFPSPPPPPAPQTPSEATNPSPSGVKALSSFLDISKTLTLPKKEIEMIWRLRHVNSPNSLCATIPLPVYQSIETTARRHPQFILPLPKEGKGTEIHFLQWTFPTEHSVTVLFTHLAEYKLRGEFSQPHTTITHHLELAEPKGLVLLQGQVLEGRGVSVEEAKWLLICLQKFYGFGGEKSERRRLLELFGKGDEQFKLEELVDEAERTT